MAGSAGALRCPLCHVQKDIEHPYPAILSRSGAAHKAPYLAIPHPRSAASTMAEATLRAYLPGAAAGLPRRLGEVRIDDDDGCS